MQRDAKIQKLIRQFLAAKKALSHTAPKNSYKNGMTLDCVSQTSTAEGHSCEFLLSNIHGYLSFYGFPPQRLLLSAMLPYHSDSYIKSSLYMKLYINGRPLADAAGYGPN